MITEKNLHVKMEELLDSFEKLSIVKSTNQSKEWRKNQDWYVNGKKNECEKYQQSQVQKIVNKKIVWKTNIRIHLHNLEMNKITKVIHLDDGLEYTEDFDGLFTYNNIPFYINLKMIISSGGAQTRSIRELYHFVEGQIQYLLQQHNTMIFFVNILDGDGCKKFMKHFIYLLKKYKNHERIEKYVFVGDMYEFKNWYEMLDSKFVFVNKIVSDIINKIE